jgi:uncharacterized protein (TIGR02145 family)
MKKSQISGLLLIPFLVLSLPFFAQTPGDPIEDPRDGQRYRTVQIGNQVWMAQNLNFGDEEKTCYGQDPAHCETYGGLYTWEVAGGVCPDGWHLPSKKEWEELSEFLGRDEAGQKLKTSRSDPRPWDGTNESGFSAIPSGAGNGEGFHRMGDWALYWSSTEYNSERAWFAQLDGYWYAHPPKYKNLYVGWYYLKTNQFSVRCVLGQDK